MTKKKGCVQTIKGMHFPAGPSPAVEEEALEADSIPDPEKIVGANMCPEPGNFSMAEPRDPWRRRSKWMQCRYCMWFVLKGVGDLGRCRRHAPTTAGYPQVYRADWCGDQRMDEAKI